MDCVACGKPISVTAKFCGKCGAPVKRSTKPVEALASTEAIAQPLAEPTTDMGVETLAEVMSAPVTEAIAEQVTEQVTEQVNEQLAEVSPVDELTFTLSPPDHMTNMRDIDLNLPQQSTAQISMEADKLKLLEQTQSEIKKTLEKHSLLLDFISLTSQQQSHQQTQPDPLEPLVSQVAEQQTSLQSQLTQLAALLSQNEAQQHSQRMPEEFKLQLEKQKIEIHKLMAQSLAQNNENLKDDQHEVIEHLEKRIEAYHQAAQQSLEKNMGALASGMSELKTQLQAVQKKAAEKSVSKSASSGADSDGGSFMIFVIGLLCGLTVVLSSLAIYNFLSHEPPKADKHDGADTHEAAPADKHDAPPAEKSH